MKKNKKILISVIVILLIIASIVTTILILNNNGEEPVQQQEGQSQTESETQKTILLRDKLENSQNYKVSLTLNDQNQRITSKNGEKAKVEIIDEGEKTTYIVKDNNTYMITYENNNNVYKYENNTSLLNDFVNKLDEITNLNYKVGTENIDGKNYKYEEFDRTTMFVINYKNNIDASNSKTRLYFDGNDLKYIKTYIGDVEQLLKADVEYNNQKDADFDVPEE